MNKDEIDSGNCKDFQGREVDFAKLSHDCNVLNENMNIVALAHILFSGKSQREIMQICEGLQMLLILSKSYC